VGGGVEKRIGPKSKKNEQTKSPGQKIATLQKKKKENHSMKTQKIDAI